MFDECPAGETAIYYLSNGEIDAIYSETMTATLDALRAIRDNITTDPTPDNIRAALEAIRKHYPAADPDITTPREIRATLTDIINGLYWDMAQDVTQDHATVYKKEIKTALKLMEEHPKFSRFDLANALHGYNPRLTFEELTEITREVSATVNRFPW